MGVRMAAQVLAPGMDHSDGRPEMLRISRNRAQRLGRRFEQDSVDRAPTA